MSLRRCAIAGNSASCLGFSIALSVGSIPAGAIRTIPNRLFYDRLRSGETLVLQLHRWESVLADGAIHL